MELNNKTIRKIFLGVAGCIILYWLLHETSRVASVFGAIFRILSPFLIGGSMAFVLNVPMRFFERRLTGIKKAALRRTTAMVITIVVVLLLMYGVFALLIPQLIETVESIANQLPGFINKFHLWLTSYLEDNPELLEWVNENTDFEKLDWNNLVQNAVSFLTDGLGNFLREAVDAVIHLGTGIFNGVISVVFAIYCLARKEILARQARRLLYAIVPEKAGDEFVRIFRMTNRTFSHFISGQCLEAVILAVLCYVAMIIFGMPHAELVSVVVGVTALVPIVGAFAGGAIGAFFILVADPPMAFWFVIMFLILQQIEGNLIYPRVVGSSVGLPGMWVLVAVAVGGELMGIGGMLVMIPIASVIYALVGEFTAKRLKKRGVPLNKLQDQPYTEEHKIFRRKPKKQAAAQEDQEDKA